MKRLLGIEIFCFLFICVLCFDDEEIAVSGLFSRFSAQWESTHESWLRIDENSLTACHGSFLFPTCLHGLNLHEPGKCPNLICLPEEKCHPTPADTLDLSFPPLSSLPVCKIPSPTQKPLPPYYGMDGGIPPEFSPLRQVNLKITGIISGGTQSSCQRIADSEIHFWQIDPRLFQISSLKSEHDLLNVTCRGVVKTDSSGRFQIDTTIPPPFGPPRHINFLIKAQGHHSLVTRLYFAQDLRLQQLAVGQEAVGGGETDGFQGTTYHYSTISNSRNKLRSILSKEPRICNVTFVDGGGYFETTDLTFSLAPVDAGSEISPNNLNGYWAESDGSLVRVETIGTLFFASQYPHIRSWGSVSGQYCRREGVIFGANFRQISQDLRERESTIAGELTEVPPELNDSRDLNRKVRPLSLSSIETVGIIQPNDGFNSNTDSGEIIWEGKLSPRVTWHKVPNPDSYRFLKLEITRVGNSELQEDFGGVIINEIEFYEGYLLQNEFPPKASKMKSPRTPFPLKVQCSSFTDQFHHCFKAFDGDFSAGSSWISKPAGERRNSLNPIAWILLDLGLENRSYGQSLVHRSRPTAMRIVCGAANPFSPSGCPMTFSLYGSNNAHDNFELITHQDFYDYSPTEFGSGGKLFHFFDSSPNGRSRGSRCGSCDIPPQFICAIDSFDRTCGSTYCGEKGVCDNPKACPPGQYRDYFFSGSGHSQYNCLFCPGGKFGNSSGLLNQFCTGECDPGCFCPKGSTQSCPYECNSEDVYCPKGSGSPIVAGAGLKTLDRFGLSSRSDLKRVSVSPCRPGRYCQNGIEIPCPAGTFGSDSYLSSERCSGECQAGFFCERGTISPLPCPLGHYCPDGRQKVKCPGGTYGDHEGLIDRECSGKCLAGYYCPEGSFSQTEMKCPKGRFGDSVGLSNENCTGLCPAGYFCPEGTAHPMTHPCGLGGVYCPVGSALPFKVSRGYYLIGSTPLTRFDQQVCKRGFYCTDTGEMLPCPPGTFGDREGLYSPIGSVQPDERNSFCSGLCKPGYYCPINSTTSESVPCPAGTYGISPGLATSNCTDLCPVGHYCPEGSITPIACPPGVFGSHRGLKDLNCHPNCSLGVCSEENREESLCREGFYCPLGSTSPFQHECGSRDVFCPLGSARPSPISNGYAAVGNHESPNQHISQRLCSLGHYCDHGTETPCPPGVFGSSVGLSSPLCSGPCPLGHYCPQGTINGSTFRCPGGRYGNESGLSDKFCSGRCSAGYFCPEGSTNPFQFECGQQGRRNSVYCPPGASVPTEVPVGYFSLGGNSTTRSMIQPCQPGTYCQAGIVFDCPAGTYGSSPLLSSPSCSGPCRRGFYCPAGSIASDQVPCPRGRRSDKEGLTNADCAGPCQNPHECE